MKRGKVERKVTALFPRWRERRRAEFQRKQTDWEEGTRDAASPRPAGCLRGS